MAGCWRFMITSTQNEVGNSQTTSLVISNYTQGMYEY